MARTVNQAIVNNFVGGLITDYHELNTPPNVSVDEDNVDIDRKGYRKRRKGIEFEDGYEFAPGPTPQALPGYYIKCHEWTSVANNGTIAFLVVQIGPTLYFYDKGAETISANRQGFTVNLNDHLAPAYSDTSEYPVQVASGKGVLFVVGERIIPFYIEYDVAGNSITVKDINLRIRDLEEAEQLFDADPKENDAELPDLTGPRLYDLYNQGWYIDGITMFNGTVERPIEYYRGESGHYPPKTAPWFIGKTVQGNGDEVFAAEHGYDMIAHGNTLAALGHFILDPFYKDRNILGLGNIPVVTKDNRPNSVAFFAGRVFYGFENVVFFSQVITDSLTVANKCYQDADPTSETISDLIDTDGGTIQIADAGQIQFLFPMQSSLLVFASNGIWIINGAASGEGFTATSYSISCLAYINAINFRTIINVDGTPTFWGDNGIYIIQPRQNYAGFEVQNIIDKKIQNFYDQIPSASRANASGIYDRVRKTVVWVYPSEAFDINPYACNKLLFLDTVMGAFYPYTIPDPDSTVPFICDVFIIRGLVTGRVEEEVVDESGDQVTTNGGSDVFTYEFETVSPSLETGGVKYLTFTPST